MRRFRIDAGQRAVFDAVVGCLFTGVSSNNLEAPVLTHCAPQNAESRVFFLALEVVPAKTFVTRAIHDLLGIR